MLHSEQHITTLVTGSQVVYHQSGYSIVKQADDNGKMIAKHKNNIHSLRKAKGVSLARLEELTGISAQQINRLEKGERRLNEDNLKSLAAALQCETADLLFSPEPRKIPVIGDVGAGAKIYPFDDLPLMREGMSEHEQEFINCDFVDAPYGVYPAGVVALRVRGDSMLPFMPDGTVVFYERRSGQCSDHIGKLCVVQLSDGQALLKVVRRGYSYGRYNLESYNAPLIEDAEVRWCAKITFIQQA